MSEEPEELFTAHALWAYGHEVLAKAKRVESCLYDLTAPDEEWVPFLATKEDLKNAIADLHKVMSRSFVVPPEFIAQPDDDIIPF